MATQRVADLTIEELRTLIDQIVVHRLQTGIRQKRDPRSAQEVAESIERNRWVPPPGAKSTLELLREDRDR